MKRINDRPRLILIVIECKQALLQSVAENSDDDGPTYSRETNAEIRREDAVEQLLRWSQR